MWPAGLKQQGCLSSLLGSCPWNCVSRPLPQMARRDGHHARRRADRRGTYARPGTLPSMQPAACASTCVGGDAGCRGPLLNASAAVAISWGPSQLEERVLHRPHPTPARDKGFGMRLEIGNACGRRKSQATPPVVLVARWDQRRPHTCLDLGKRNLLLAHRRLFSSTRGVLGSVGVHTNMVPTMGPQPSGRDTPRPTDFVNGEGSAAMARRPTLDSGDLLHKSPTRGAGQLSRMVPARCNACGR